MQGVLPVSPPTPSGAFMEKYKGFPELGVAFWGPYNKDYSILGSILGSPYFEKLPYTRCILIMVATEFIGMCRLWNNDNLVKEGLRSKCWGAD